MDKVTIRIAEIPFINAETNRQCPAAHPFLTPKRVSNQDPDI